MLAVLCPAAVLTRAIYIVKSAIIHISESSFGRFISSLMPLLRDENRVSFVAVCFFLINIFSIFPSLSFFFKSPFLHEVPKSSLFITQYRQKLADAKCNIDRGCISENQLSVRDNNKSVESDY